MIADFEVTGVALGMLDDTDTVALGVFGLTEAESSVCVFKFKSSVWSQDGECVSSNELPVNTLAKSTFGLLGKTTYAMTKDTHDLVTGFISDNVDNIAHFQAYDVPHAGIEKRGKIVSVKAGFSIVGVALQMSDDDTDTLYFGVYGIHKSLVCMFKFKSSLWIQDNCFPYDLP